MWKGTTYVDFIAISITYFSKDTTWIKSYGVQYFDSIPFKKWTTIYGREPILFFWTFLRLFLSKNPSYKEHAIKTSIWIARISWQQRSGWTDWIFPHTNLYQLRHILLSEALNLRRALNCLLLNIIKTESKIWCERQQDELPGYFDKDT